MLLGGASSGSPGLGGDRRTALQMSEDNAITAAIRSRYNMDTAVSAANIGVLTYMKDVTLSGTVGSFALRDRAVSIARNTDRVRAVNSQIQVNTNK